MIFHRGRYIVGGMLLLVVVRLSLEGPPLEAVRKAAPSSAVPFGSSDGIRQRITNHTTQQQSSSDKMENISHLILQDDLVIVSGYWMIPKNVKHPVKAYSSWIGTTMRMCREQNVSVVFYHNLDLGRNAARRHSFASPLISDKVELKYRPLSELDGSSDALSLIDMCIEQPYDLPVAVPKKDKAITHKKHINESSTEAWISVVNVWISKLSLMEETIRNKPEVRFFMWLDAGIGRKWDGSFFPYMQQTPLDSRHVYFRSSPMFFNGSKIKFSAGLVLGAREPFLAFIERFKMELERVISSKVPLCHDEETIIDQMYREDEQMQEIMASFVGKW